MTGARSVRLTALFGVLAIAAGCAAPESVAAPSAVAEALPTPVASTPPQSTSTEPGPPAATPQTAEPATIGGLTAEQKHRADQLISIFENATPEIQYAYAEDIHDGRGITSGRAGFCTGTGDALIVVQRYARIRPDADIVGYLPELERLDSSDDPSDTSGLDGYVEAWAAAAEDPDFRAVQDQVTDELYFLPTVGYAEELGLTTPLARAAIYDAALMHGDGDDPDGLRAMLDRAGKRVGGTPASGVDEADWLAAFLDVRHKVLLHATDPETREEWAEAADRPLVWKRLLDDGNLDLRGPIAFTLGDYEIDIP